MIDIGNMVHEQGDIVGELCHLVKKKRSKLNRCYIMCILCDFKESLFPQDSLFERHVWLPDLTIYLCHTRHFCHLFSLSFFPVLAKFIK